MGLNQQQREFNPEKLGLKQQNWSLSYINYVYKWDLTIKYRAYHWNMSQDQKCRVESIPSRASQIIQGELVHKLFITLIIMKQLNTTSKLVSSCFAPASRYILQKLTVRKLPLRSRKDCRAMLSRNVFHLGLFEVLNTVRGWLIDGNSRKVIFSLYTNHPPWAGNPFLDQLV